MSPTEILNLLLGSGGALVVLAIACFFLYRDNRSLQTQLDEERDARLKDLKESEMLARAYLSIREKERT